MESGIEIANFIETYGWIVFLINLVLVLIVAVYLYQKDKDNLNICILGVFFECLFIVVMMFGIVKNVHDQEKEKHRFQDDKELLLKHLEPGQCGDICLKKDWKMTGAPPAIKKYWNCEVSINICK